MKIFGAPLICVLSFLLAGCTKPPDEVRTFKTPLSGVTLIYETRNYGPLVSDTNRLIARYTLNDKKTTFEILNGDYLVFSKFVWESPKKLVLCYKKGTVYDFTNEAELRIGDATKNFHVTLKEDC